MRRERQAYLRMHVVGVGGYCLEAILFVGAHAQGVCLLLGLRDFLSGSRWL